MEQITFKVIGMNGQNATVEYTCGEHTLQIGMDFPTDATPEQLIALVSSQAPVQHFGRLTNPVPVDAMVSLVGLSGGVVIEPLIAPTTQANGPQANGPQAVTRLQGRAALLQAGLLDTVETIMSNPDVPALQRLAWQDALTFERNSLTMKAMASMLSLTDEQLDQLFITASAIHA